MAPATKQKFVTSEELDAKLDDFLTKIVGVMKESTPIVAPAVTPETPEQVEIKKAGPNPGQTNPEWDEMARSILGDDVIDHTEKSNAPKDYMDRMGQDRRSKEIGQEGITGVEAWCKLILQNLHRPK